ncbi:hypothetical protein A2331_03915 [Candidatus Falkowbacteria bacterium RIFOXYB2_FULL_34_18]|uniref:HTH cro/C1-type domain-containing protein n=1 Tax=Candidatus Falkowbacteria bacterium RIFOXYD2_FULL_34_120 TaxID=1798007 RepID=A0A1F5TPG0_9BACT|nr:MAG: hypothetical protein A2331_03915 [Candidatus Falkowbacteria bacterium RIFOXYB2_FULL_34_18]OGF29097.1 MAG: hypothetical protein A2500_03240 [Candidatus Falkowbacteria bacterium RIFOXYC12_FULL_34_55]OGF36180.1 MAG: hypothetical protein A2466_04770 [Candidatus Falkowbacteria bacterium RIFOXYC2_FULL_34_220]OGF38607.1 MAG: hypothetical protein A2515_02130 [Candidatus Falkowbacteria bacterium RIFOXYD12_FULL_34_57]OGF40790.1 MAG: hypothetical protein A2531_06775 [Candidatus Falkowbacteria bact
MTKGQIIKLLRLKNNVSQQELADKTGVTANYLSLIENGKRNPPLSFLKKIADAFDISVNLLIWEKIDYSNIKNKESREIAKKVNENLNNIYKLLFNELVKSQ